MSTALAPESPWAAPCALVVHALAVSHLVDAAKLLELALRVGNAAADLQAALDGLCHAVDRVDAAESALAPEPLEAAA